MSRQLFRGSSGVYQADEQAGVARLRSQVSGRWAGRCHTTVQILMGKEFEFNRHLGEFLDIARCLARSLAKEPRLLLLDEPMGALDKKLREQMRLELVDIINSVGVTCLMVTHDQEEAMTMADRIAIMDRGEFVQIGGPREIYENPNCRFSAEFIGSVNMFDCTLTSSNLKHSVISCQDFPLPIELQHDIDIADGMPLSIAMRPEKVYISHEEPKQESNWCSGIVENIAYLGDISIYYVRLPSGRIITATLPNVDRFNVGFPTWDDQVYLSWDPESCIALTF